MTWWGALLGFVGALAGSWGGQLIASRREDRRWQREREREDVRHTRELEKLKLQHAREVDLAWRSERRTIYGQFLTALVSWEGLAHQLIKDTPLPPVSDSEIQQQWNELNNLFNMLMVSGSPNVREAGQQAVEACRGVVPHYTSMITSAGPARLDADDVAMEVTSSSYGFAEICRRELGLESQSDVEERAASDK